MKRVVAIAVVFAAAVIPGSAASAASPVEACRADLVAEFNRWNANPAPEAEMIPASCLAWHDGAFVVSEAEFTDAWVAAGGNGTNIWMGDAR